MLKLIILILLVKLSALSADLITNQRLIGIGSSSSISSSSSSSGGVANQQQQPLFSNVCQSGIREDNTNYIYCARRALNEIPIFSKNNVVYDELVLTDNRITVLNSDSFSRIKVKKIYLNGNPIKRIDPVTFTKLENHLEELWLDADTLSSSSVEPNDQMIGLPKAILNLRNLNTLRLKGFMIRILENSILKRLNRIEILSLQFCSIETIQSLAFDGLKNSLKELYLDGNQLQQIPTESLLTVGFKSLKILSLSQNNIKTIGLDSFGVVNSAGFSSSDSVSISKIAQQQQPSQNQQEPALKTIIKLDLSYNGLKLIDQYSFNCFNTTLETLLLQNNEINSFNLKFIRQLNGLKELNLDFNIISRLNANIFLNSQRLQYLSLQGNSIMFDEEEQDNQQQQQQTEERMNRYETTSVITKSVFDGLIGLQRLNLARNGIKYLPRHLFEPMENLKSLILDKNPIENYDRYTFDGLHLTLMNISLQNTKMKSKHLISLKNLQRLERVKLGFNELTEIDWSVFSKMHLTLTNLDAQNNQINHIYSSTCAQDDSISMSGDGSQPFAEYIVNQTAENCNYQMESLLELDVSNNKLCDFNAKLLNKMPKLKNLGLSQNPLYCDCNLLPLYEWTRRKFDKDILSFIQWQCELPPSSSKPITNSNQQEASLPVATKPKRRQFTSLNVNDFVCSNGSANAPAVSKCSKSSTNKLSIQIKSAETTTTTTTSTKSSTSSTKDVSSLSISTTTSTANNLIKTIELIDLNRKKSSNNNNNNDDSSSATIYDADFLISSSNPSEPRISNVILSNDGRNVYVNWELDEPIVADQSQANDGTANTATSNEIRGFKISYNQQMSNSGTGSGSSSSSSGGGSDNKFLPNDFTTFVTDKTQRQFKIENLKPDAKYTICVSIIRYQGYDKYCRDIDMSISNEQSQYDVDPAAGGGGSGSGIGVDMKKSTRKQQTKLTSNLAVVSSPSLLPSSSSNNNNNNNMANSNFISGLMITVLALLVTFIIGLIVFIYFYIKRCRRNQKKISRSKSLIMNNTATMNSRRTYTGAILATTTNTAINTHLDKRQVANLNGDNNNGVNSNIDFTSNRCCCNCETLNYNTTTTSSTTNARFIQNSTNLVTTVACPTNNSNDQQQLQQNYHQKCGGCGGGGGMGGGASNDSSSSSSPQSSSTGSSSNHFCSCIRLGLGGVGCSTLARALTIGDTSTVSSTLSSVNTSGACAKTQLNQTCSGNCCSKDQQQQQFQQQQQINFDMENLNTVDMLTISPTNQQIHSFGHLDQLQQQQTFRRLKQMQQKCPFDATSRMESTNAIQPPPTAASAAVVMTTTSPDSATSPSSFTHFIVQQFNNNSKSQQQSSQSNQPQQQQQQQPQPVSLSYIPYELYNCFQNANTNPAATLVMPTMHTTHQQLLAQFANSNNNSKKQQTNSKLNQLIIANGSNSNTTNDKTNTNDHVYCEIPSTIGRSCRNSCQLIYNTNSNDAQLLLPSSTSNNNPAGILYFSPVNNKTMQTGGCHYHHYQPAQHQLQQQQQQHQLQQQQQQLQSNELNNQQRYTQQNSSTSLLISSSSSSSSSPQQITTNTNPTNTTSLPLSNNINNNNHQTFAHLNHTNILNNKFTASII